MWESVGRFGSQKRENFFKGKQINFKSLYQETGRVVSNLIYLETLNVSNLLVVPAGNTASPTVPMTFKYPTSLWWICQLYDKEVNSSWTASNEKTEEITYELGACWYGCPSLHGLHWRTWSSNYFHYVTCAICHAHIERPKSVKIFAGFLILLCTLHSGKQARRFSYGFQTLAVVRRWY
jgi:hypothetical protein